MKIPPVLVLLDFQSLDFLSSVASCFISSADLLLVVICFSSVDESIPCVDRLCNSLFTSCSRGRMSLLPCERDSENRRVFNEELVNWMQGIQCLKGCGASIGNTKEYCHLCLLKCRSFKYTEDKIFFCKLVSFENRSRKSVASNFHLFEYL